MKKIVIGLFLLVFLTGCSLTNRIMVSGDSMEPTLKAGEIRTYRKNGPIQRYDIIVVNYQGEKLIKRVYALPGETIKCTNGKLFINDNLIDDIYGKEQL